MAEHDIATSGMIDGGVHVYPVRVYYDDTDAAGIVYYANYLRMAERARTEMLRMVGVKHTALVRDNGVSIADSRCEVDYLLPARLDDDLHIRTRITALGGREIDGPDSFRRRLAGFRNSNNVLLSVVRGHRLYRVTLPLDKGL